VPSGESKHFAETKLAVFVRGEISYNNGFDEVETIPLCYYFFGYQITLEATNKQDVRPLVRRCDSEATFANMIRHTLFEIGLQQGTIPNGTPYPY
jgi:hypothetical protein